MCVYYFEKRSWIEIDLNQLETNYKILREYLNPNKKIMAVVKANAYGHGDRIIAKKLYDIGVRDFGVSSLDEACNLRNHGIKGNILIFGYTPAKYASVIYENDIIQTIVSEEHANDIIKMNIPIKCNFALDTGMNRIGLCTRNVEKCVNIIKRYNSELNITGVFTHLCVADELSEESKQFTNRQMEIYNKILSKISDLYHINYNHCLNSAGALWYKSDCTNIIRLGIVLYGLKPNYQSNLPKGLKPILQWKSVVSMVKWVERGETIGYGRTYKVNKKMKVATIPTGYADGYNRLLSNKGHVIVNNQKAPIVGNICMDQLMIDVTDIDNVSMDTEVILIGDSENLSYSADDMAKDIGTIGYEVVCNISQRVPKFYL